MGNGVWEWVGQKAFIGGWGQGWEGVLDPSGSCPVGLGVLGTSIVPGIQTTMGWSHTPMGWSLIHPSVPALALPTRSLGGARFQGEPGWSLTKQKDPQQTLGKPGYSSLGRA